MRIHLGTSPVVEVILQVSISAREEQIFEDFFLFENVERVEYVVVQLFGLD